MTPLAGAIYPLIGFTFWHLALTDDPALTPRTSRKANEYSSRSVWSVAAAGSIGTADLLLGEPHVTQAVASVPLRLRVHGHERLVPSFYGSFDMAWLGPARTQLALSLQHEPPLGIVGRAVDRTLLHRVAETVARSFLEVAARRLEERRARGRHGPEVTERAAGP